MRALLAAVLALGLLLTVAAPHVHELGHGSGDCTACVARHGDVARSETPDVGPGGLHHAEAVVAEPAHAPVTGAPLGAIPGQSPPAAA